MDKINPKKIWLKSLLRGPNGKPYAEINEHNLTLFYGPLLAKWTIKIIPWSSIKEFKTIVDPMGSGPKEIHTRLVIHLQPRDLGLEQQYENVPCAKGTKKEEFKDFLNDCLRAFN